MQLCLGAICGTCIEQLFDLVDLSSEIVYSFLVLLGFGLECFRLGCVFEDLLRTFRKGFCGFVAVCACEVVDELAQLERNYVGHVENLRLRVTCSRCGVWFGWEGAPWISAQEVDVQELHIRWEWKSVNVRKEPGKG